MLDDSVESGTAAGLSDVSSAGQSERFTLSSLMGLTTAGLALTLIYGIADLIDMVQRAVPLGTALLSYLALLSVPAAGRRFGRTRPQQAEGIALAVEVSYTAVLCARLLLPDTTVSGTALILSLKMLGTALLLHWRPVMQYVSVGSSLVLYWTFLVLSGHIPAAGNAMHQIVGPLMAALLSIIGTANTQRHRRALLESESRLRSLLDAIPDGAMVLDGERIVFANPRLAMMLGYASVGDILHRNLADLAGVEGAVTLGNHLCQTPSTATRPALDTHLRCADGKLLDVAITVAPLRYADRPAVQVMVRDVTERRRVEEERAGLLDIARAISGTLDLDAILDRVQQHTAALLDCDRVATFGWDTAYAGLRMIGQFGTPPELLEDAMQRTFPLPRQPIDPHNPPKIVVSGSSQDVLPTELLAHFGVQTLAAVPLWVRDRPYGAFAVFRAKGERPFDKRQIELLESIAHQVALAIEMSELYRTEQEDALVSGTVARVARELIAAMQTPTLLSRLCQLTSEALGTDFSLTYLWRSDEHCYVAAAGHGMEAEEWDAVRTLKVAPRAVAGLVKRLEQNDFVQLSMADFASELPAAIALRYGVTHCLYVTLRDVGNVVGTLIAGYRGRTERFSAHHERIASGIGQIASLVLQNARLIDELDRANRLKSDFVATMSHELRTPLNIILGYTDLMMEGAFGGLSGEQNDTLQRVDHSAQQLLGLINMTLDVSRMDAGQVDVDWRETSIGDLLKETATEMRELWERSGLSFDCTVDANLPRIYSDPVKLKVIFKNLLGNAVKFTEHGGITIAAERRKDGLEISVTDTGIGIPREAMSIIFERFRQADGSATRRHGGVGLGLYIVRRLLEALQGQISVESTLGCGSTFRIWLPQHPQVISRRAAAPSKSLSNNA